MVRHKPVTIVILLCAAASDAALAKADFKPLKIPPTLSPAVENVKRDRRWDIETQARINRITSIAVNSNGDKAAFVVRFPDLVNNTNRYALYLADTSATKGAVKVLEAKFISDVLHRPNSQEWTILADLGKGVQAYRLSRNSYQVESLVESSATINVGPDGEINSQVDEVQRVGILGLGWSPDGSRFWYSKARTRRDDEVAVVNGFGVRYDENSMVWLDFNPKTKLAGIELRVVSAGGGTERLVAYDPYSFFGARANFRSGSVQWTSIDLLDFQTFSSIPDKSLGLSRKSWRFNVASGALTPLVHDINISRALRVKGGWLKVNGPGQPLLEVRDDGEETSRGRPVFEHIVPFRGSAYDAETGDYATVVRYPERYSITTSFSANAMQALASETGSLSRCGFGLEARTAVCVRESFNDAPELVTVDLVSGMRKSLADPNADLRRMAPFRIEAATWTNANGDVATGFISYPRSFRTGKRYPAIVVTHGSDAKETFADEDFQWSYPVQTWLERGYLVVSVNEPQLNDVAKARIRAAASASSDPSVLEAQGQNLNVVLTLQAAVQDLNRRGLINIRNVGLAGYSRGAAIARLAVSQTKTFNVVSTGDGSLFDTGQYWRSGSLMQRRSFERLFGNHPWHDKAIPNVKRFAPSARPEHISAALLQQFAANQAHTALELHVALRSLDRPTELFFFPGEAHFFAKPWARMGAMEQNLDWFDFWMCNREVSSPNKQEQYKRWQTMRDTAQYEIRTC